MLCVLNIPFLFEIIKGTDAKANELCGKILIDFNGLWIRC